MSRTPFTSYEHFVSVVQVMAGQLAERTGVAWTVTPLAPGQTLADSLAQQREAERQAAQREEDRRRLSLPRKKLVGQALTS